MAARAALGWIDLPIVNELRTLLDLNGGRRGLPREVVDLVQRAQHLLGIAVTIETERHVQRFLLTDYGLLVNAAVTLDATDAAIHVHRMVEINVIRNLVDLDPANCFAGLDAPFNQSQGGALGLHNAVTVPTRIGRRHVGVSRTIDEVMAITAIQTEDRIRSGMKGVIESHRLIRCITDIEIFIGRVFVHRRNDDHARNQQTDQNLERCGIDGTGEEIPPRGRTVKVIEELTHRGTIGRS